jgi:prepilin-type N-terminal cleavage/methylation domain-containing protein
MIRKIQLRRGFTLVEVLVAMALTIFILTILAEAFIAGADMFRGLKAVGDLNQSLRTTTNILSSDLAADHFEGKRRLSDAKFWTNPYNGPPIQGYFYLEQNPNLPPIFEGRDVDGLPMRRCVGHKMAFTVKARGNSPQNFYSAPIPFLTIPGVPNPLQSPLSGVAQTFGSPDGRYQLGSTFNSQWVEVSYFLVQLPGVTAQGTPLYALYRQQRLILPDNTRVNWNMGIVPGVPGIPVLSSPTTPTWLQTYGPKFSVQVNPATAAQPLPLQSLYFNNPADLTIPERRTSAVFQPGITAKRINVFTVGGVASPPKAIFTPATFSPIVDATGALTGEDLLLTDVLSFEITALRSDDTSDFYDLPNFYTPTFQPTAPYPQPNWPPPANYYMSPNSPWGPGYFDTWSNRRDDIYNYMNTSNTVATGTPIPTTAYHILALKITIRIYDERAQVARQTTLIQEL